MTEKAESGQVDNTYRVISVEEIAAPEGMQDGKWHHYVIGHGNSKIEGKRQGTLKAVTRHAEEFAENLNLRGSKGYSSYMPRNQKK